MAIRVSRQHAEALVVVDNEGLGVSRQRIELLYADDSLLNLRVSRQHVDPPA